MGNIIPALMAIGNIAKMVTTLINFLRPPLPPPVQQPPLVQPPSRQKGNIRQRIMAFAPIAKIVTALPPPSVQPPSPQKDESSSNPNLDFYQNKIPSKPNGAKFEEILSEWYGNYEKLKDHTFYIQWLFPNRDRGTNPQASPLTDEEAKVCRDVTRNRPIDLEINIDRAINRKGAKIPALFLSSTPLENTLLLAIRSDPVLRERVRRAFKMILDLYGMALNDRNEFKLIDDDKKFLKHFISHRVSHMWVSRILKALKDLGHQELMLPWLKFLKKLIHEDHVLSDKFQKPFTEFWTKTLDATDLGIILETPTRE